MVGWTEAAMQKWLPKWPGHTGDRRDFIKQQRVLLGLSDKADHDGKGERLEGADASEEQVKEVCNALRCPTEKAQLSVALVALFFWLYSYSDPVAQRCMECVMGCVPEKRRSTDLQLSLIHQLDLALQSVLLADGDQARLENSTNVPITATKQSGDNSAAPIALVMKMIAGQLPTDFLIVRLKTAGRDELSAGLYVSLFPAPILFTPQLHIAGSEDVLKAGQQIKFDTDNYSGINQNGYESSMTWRSLWGTRAVNNNTLIITSFGSCLLPDSSATGAHCRWLVVTDDRGRWLAVEVRREPLAAQPTAVAATVRDQRAGQQDFIYHALQLIIQRHGFSVGTPSKHSTGPPSSPSTSPCTSALTSAPEPTPKRKRSAAALPTPAVSKPEPESYLTPVEGLRGTTRQNRAHVTHPGSCGKPPFRDVLNLLHDSIPRTASRDYVSINKSVANSLSFGNQAPVCITVPPHGVLNALHTAVTGLRVKADDASTTASECIKQLKVWVNTMLNERVCQSLMSILKGLQQYHDVKAYLELIDPNNLLITMKNLLLTHADFLDETGLPWHDRPATIYVMTRLWAELKGWNVLFQVQLDTQINNQSKRLVFSYIVKPCDDHQPIASIILQPHTDPTDTSSSAATRQPQYEMFVVAQRNLSHTDADNDDSDAQEASKQLTLFHSQHVLYPHLRDLCLSVTNTQLAWTKAVPSAPAVPTNFGTSTQTKQYIELQKKSAGVKGDGKKEVGAASGAKVNTPAVDVITLDEDSENDETPRKRPSRRGQMVDADNEQQTDGASRPASKRRRLERAAKQQKADEQSVKQQQARTAEEDEMLDVDQPQRSDGRGKRNEDEVNKSDGEGEKDGEEEEDEDQSEADDPAEASGSEYEGAHTEADKEAVKQLSKQITKPQLEKFLVSKLGRRRPKVTIKVPNVLTTRFANQIGDWVNWCEDENVAEIMNISMKEYLLTSKAKYKDDIQSVAQMHPTQQAGMWAAVHLAYDKQLQKEYVELSSTWTEQAKSLSEWKESARDLLKGRKELIKLASLSKKAKDTYHPSTDRPWLDKRDHSKMSAAAESARSAYDNKKKKRQKTSATSVSTPNTTVAPAHSNNRPAAAIVTAPRAVPGHTRATRSNTSVRELDLDLPPEFEISPNPNEDTKKQPKTKKRSAAKNLKNKSSAKKKAVKQSEQRDVADGSNRSEDVENQNAMRDVVDDPHQQAGNESRTDTVSAGRGVVDSAPLSTPSPAVGPTIPSSFAQPSPATVNFSQSTPATTTASEPAIHHSSIVVVNQPHLASQPEDITELRSHLVTLYVRVRRNKDDHSLCASTWTEIEQKLPRLATALGQNNLELSAQLGQEAQDILRLAVTPSAPQTSPGQRIPINAPSSNDSTPLRAPSSPNSHHPMSLTLAQPQPQTSFVPPPVFDQQSDSSPSVLRSPQPYSALSQPPHALTPSLGSAPGPAPRMMSLPSHTPRSTGQPGTDTAAQGVAGALMVRGDDQTHYAGEIDTQHHVPYMQHVPAMVPYNSALAVPPEYVRAKVLYDFQEEEYDRREKSEKRRLHSEILASLNQSQQAVMRIVDAHAEQPSRMLPSYSTRSSVPPVPIFPTYAPPPPADLYQHGQQRLSGSGGQSRWVSPAAAAAAPAAYAPQSYYDVSQYPVNFHSHSGGRR